MTQAKILAVREETSSVRELILQVADPAFTFKAGNWVDFFIDGVDKVGGYSMCSVPAELPRLRLAVKRSAHAPAAWCHSAAAPGAQVQLKAGGQFSWDPAADGPVAEHLLLVAGGIGINPLYSMAQAALAAPRESVPRLRRVSMLYSAATPSELAYRAHLEELAAGDDRLHLGLRVTRKSEAAGQALWTGSVGRIDRAVLASALEEAAAPRVATLAYVCGPPSMTDALVAILRDELRLPAECVRFEKWW